MNVSPSVLAWLQSPVHVVNVFTQDQEPKFLLGTLNYNVEKRSSSFQWSEQALARGHEWSPLRMPLQKNLHTFLNLPTDFNGLPGLLNDALPDGWGLLLMDKAFKKMSIAPQHLTPAFRLAFLGDRCWGSLCFEPDYQPDSVAAPFDLQALSGEVHQMIEGELDDVSHHLLMAGGSPHGARPKIMVDLDTHNRAQISGGRVDDGFESWIIKFAARDEHPEAPLGEHVYMTLAQQMGLEVCASRILQLNGKPAFATKRFDRIEGKKRFTHSLSGLLHVTHRQSNLDYTNIGQILNHLNASDQLEQAFRRACFNVALSVRDDHSKNVSFVKDGGKWGLSPAYDLTYMDGPGGYHSMNYADCPERDPTRKFVLQVGMNYGLDKPQCEHILNEAIEISNQFASTANAHHISKKWISPIEKRLKQLNKNLRPSTVAAPKRSV